MNKMPLISSMNLELGKELKVEKELNPEHTNGICIAYLAALSPESADRLDTISMLQLHV